MQIRPQELTAGFDTSDCGVQTNLCSKLVKADFTGAMVKVSNSKNKVMIGVEGLVVRETTRTFVVIQKNDEVKVLIKEGSVFQFTLPSQFKDTKGCPLAVNIWGDNILYRGSERTKIKFKEKYNLALY